MARAVKHLSIVGINVENIVDHEEVTVGCETNGTCYSMSTDGKAVSYSLSLNGGDSFIKCEYEEIPPRVVQAFGEELLEIAWKQAEYIRENTEEEEDEEEEEDTEDDTDEDDDDDDEDDEDEDED